MNNNSLNILGQLKLAETRGYSAYEVAVLNGYTGTEQEWLDSLIGPQGPQGEPGPQGIPGTPPQIRIGRVDTLAPEQDAYVNITGTTSVVDLNFGIPRGKDGEGGTEYTETDPVFSGSPSAGITNQDIDNWNNKSDFSGNYNDLINKPTIPVVPTNISAFTNDVGYLTNHQDLSNYIQKSQTSGLVKNDGTIDTNTYLTQHQDISGKMDASKVKNVSSTTAGDVYDVRYINSMLGNIESLLGGI